jgi:dTDP-4-amino-4,6-dideoxygalactose transaminase
MLISRLANHFGVDDDQIALSSNATTALMGGVITSSERNSIWECPAWTFTASPAAVVSSNRRIQFLDLQESENLVPTSGCKNFLEVLQFGDAPHLELDPSREVIHLIDAAASFDALRHNRFIHIPKTAYVVSMHATKLIGAGEGGIFLSSDREWIKKFKAWSNFGMDGTGDRNSYSIGINSKLSEYSCAVALASMDLWEETRGTFLMNSQKAISLSTKYGLEVSSAMKSGFATPYWVVKTKNPIEKEILKVELNSNGVQHRDWWEHGSHKMHAYRNDYVTELPITDRLASTTLGLPFHYYLEERDWELIEKSLHAFRKKSSLIGT